MLFDQISFISDHDLIFCSLSINLTPVVIENTFSYRDYKSIDLLSLQNDASLLDWSDCWFASSVDDKLKIFTDSIFKLFDRHVILRSVRVKNTSVPWYTTPVKLALKKRHKCYAKWKRNPTSLNWDEHKKARN